MQVVVGTGLLQHDYGRSREGGLLELYRPGVPPLPQYSHIDFELKPDETILTRIRQKAGRLDFVRFGRYASGDTFVNDLATRQRLTDLGVSAVDMECAAVAQVADHFGIPWLVAKGISDDASHLSHDAFLEGLAEAARQSARAVKVLLPAMRE
jgi:nucleoside phosphorylase